MIQRVQSVYMFLVVVLMSFLLMFPVISFEHQDGSILKFFSYGLKRISESGNEVILYSFPLLILVLVITILNFINIFLYKKRTMQIRICVFTILLMIGLVFLCFYYQRYINNNVPVTNHTLKLPMVIPLICIIFNLLAIRGIGADELLVRSYDRLRK